MELSDHQTEHQLLQNILITEITSFSFFLIYEKLIDSPL